MRNKILLLLILALCMAEGHAKSPRSFWPAVYGPADAIVAQLDTCGPEIFADKKPLIDKLYLMARQHPEKPALMWRAKFWDASMRKNIDNNYDQSLKLCQDAMKLVSDTNSYDYHISFKSIS